MITPVYKVNPDSINQSSITNDKSEIIWPLRCSHRGGSADEAENTMAAFRNSMENNIRYLELDVHLTLDDEVIVAHDYNLTRTCDLSNAEGREYIGEFNFEDLPPFNKKFTTGLIGDLTFENTNDKDYKICKLEELFIYLNQQENLDAIVNIDLKSGPSAKEFNPI